MWNNNPYASPAPTGQCEEFAGFDPDNYERHTVMII
jgi:hypothetical protein